jgi:hypothetical protein
MWLLLYLVIAGRECCFSESENGSANLLYDVQLQGDS